MSKVKMIVEVRKSVLYREEVEIDLDTAKKLQIGTDPAPHGMYWSDPDCEDGTFLAAQLDYSKVPYDEEVDSVQYNPVPGTATND